MTIITAKKGKKLIAILMAAALLVGMLPTGALAESGSQIGGYYQLGGDGKIVGEAKRSSEVVEEAGKVL